MKFGKVEDPTTIDFKLPETHPDTFKVLKKHIRQKPLEAYVGCAKWNKNDLKGFYPRGTKDELSYYSTQFNSIEMNATFYHSPSKSQVEVWKSNTPQDFKFFPKIPQSISHYSRLLNTTEKVTAFTDALSFFEEQLGSIFLQLHDNFKPKDLERLASFVRTFPKGFPLAVEVRNEEWFSNPDIFDTYCQLLESNHCSNVIVDTAGRRDMLHLRLTNDTAFVRYVGANHESDYSRLDDWLDRITTWHQAGLQKLYFFVHQNIEKDSPLLATYFIKKLNKALNLSLRYPDESKTLF